MPRVRKRYVANNSDMRKHMLGDETRDAAVSVAKEIIPVARGFAPTSTAAEKGAGDGTHYQDHFFIDESRVVTIQDGAYSNPRAAAAVVNDSDYAPQVEFGEGARVGGTRRPQRGTHGAPARPLGRAGAVFAPETYKGGPPQ